MKYKNQSILLNTVIVKQIWHDIFTNDLLWSVNVGAVLNSDHVPWRFDQDTALAGSINKTFQLKSYKN